MASKVSRRCGLTRRQVDGEGSLPARAVCQHLCHFGSPGRVSTPVVISSVLARRRALVMAHTLEMFSENNGQVTSCIGGLIIQLCLLYMAELERCFGRDEKSAPIPENSSGLLIYPGGRWASAPPASRWGHIFAPIFFLAISLQREQVVARNLAHTYLDKWWILY